MADDKDKIVLDDEAEKLYQMLGGLDSRDRVDTKVTLPEVTQAGLIGSLMKQE